VAYTVNDRGDVNDRLDELGIDSVRDIRRAHGSYRHRLSRAEDAGRLDLHATGSPAEFAANIAALQAANTELRRQADVVDGLLAEARTLATPMQDGHGPIARVMKRAFGKRAGDAQGVVLALTEYREELHRVLNAIQRTLDSYHLTEEAARQRLTVSGGDNA
jgi:hypothetical protein